MCAEGMQFYCPSCTYAAIPYCAIFPFLEHCCIDIEFDRTHTTDELKINKKTLISQDLAQEIVNKYEEAGPDQPIDENRVSLWHHVSSF